MPAADFNLLSQFQRIDLVYMTIDNTSLSASVLVPKSIPLDSPQSVPVLVHFHGGALITGTNPDPSFLSRWLAALALTTPSLLISPAYRLLPEVSGAAILDDVSSFWTWLHSESFTSSLHAVFPNLNPELTSVAAAGESAGGYLSLQSAFLFPHARIAAVLATYPAQYPDIAAYNPRAGGDAAAETIFDEGLARLGKPPRVSSPWPECRGLIEAMCRTGRHREMMGDDVRLTARGALAVARGVMKKLPGIWIIQGEEDDLVPKTAADELVGLIKEVFPRVSLKYTVEKGGHTFDLDCDLDEAWVKEGIAFVNRFWPGVSSKST